MECHQIVTIHVKSVSQQANLNLGCLTGAAGKLVPDDDLNHAHQVRHIDVIIAIHIGIEEFRIRGGGSFTQDDIDDANHILDIHLTILIQVTQPCALKFGSRQNDKIDPGAIGPFRYRSILFIAPGEGVLARINSVLMVMDLAEMESSQQIEELLKERDDARQKRNWERADAIRDELRGRGIEIIDTPDGTTWRTID